MIDIPDWIEVVPHTQDGVEGVLVRTRDGVCEDGKRRGMFVADVSKAGCAVDILVSRQAVGAFAVIGHKPRYRRVNGRLERVTENQSLTFKGDDMDRKKKAKVVAEKKASDTSICLVRRQVDTDIYGRPVYRWVLASDLNGGG